MLRTTSFLKYWLPVVVWMLLIFSASTGAMSSQHTSRIIGPLLRWLKPDISEATVERVVLTVRKTAHVTEYAILALLFWRARRKPLKSDTRPWSWSEALLALAFAAFYAASDEFHQSFVASRQGQFSDVLLDTAGGGIGLLTVWCIGRWRRVW